jgi:hypothetical protein
LKIKALHKMRGKKAKKNTHINQRVADAMGFVARIPQSERDWRAAAQVLCISQHA